MGRKGEKNKVTDSKISAKMQKKKELDTVR